MHDDSVCALSLAALQLHKFAVDPATIFGIVTCGHCLKPYIAGDEPKPCPHCNTVAA